MLPVRELDEHDDRRLQTLEAADDLGQIREVVIDDAQAYWLGDIVGNPLGPGSDRTLAPLTKGLSMIQAGADPETIVVWARLEDGDIYLVAEGIGIRNDR